MASINAKNSYTDEYNAIADLFTKGWGKTTPVAYENLNFSPKNGEDFVRFSIRNGESRVASLGLLKDNLKRYTGVVYIQIFTPLNSGVMKQKKLADKVCGIFRNASLEYFVFQPAYIQELPAENDGWNNAVVMIPFTRDSIL